MKLLLIQTDICEQIQAELCQAIANQDWQAVALISPILKDLSETLKNFQVSTGENASSSSRSWIVGNGRERKESYALPSSPPVPRIPSSYAWPDGFVGVTEGKIDEDAWQ